MYVRDTIAFDEMVNVHDRGFHHIHIRLNVSSSPFDIHAVYRPPSYIYSEFLKIFDNIFSNQQNSKYCMLIGDVNFPVNRTNCPMVQAYNQLLKCYNFVITNTFPTRPASKNVLDHVVCSDALLGCVVNETLPTDFSDHCFVLSSICLKNPVQKV